MLMQKEEFWAVGATDSFDWGSSKHTATLWELSAINEKRRRK